MPVETYDQGHCVDGQMPKSSIKFWWVTLRKYLFNITSNEQKQNNTGMVSEPFLFCA